jgi:hypothetical protein
MRAEDNQEHVRELLGERQPGLAAALRAVERQMDQELSAHPRGWRRTMNTAWLYHLDGSVCVDRWSCREQEHTSIPPQCGARADDRPIGCELAKGHPGPHLHLADQEHPVRPAEGEVGARLLAADNRKGDRARYPCRAG